MINLVTIIIFVLFPASNAKAAYATGRGIQPRGVRVKDNAVFYVHTKGAGEGQVGVQIFGPGMTHSV